jgi:hypothetical protein
VVEWGVMLWCCGHVCTSENVFLSMSHSCPSLP